MSKLVSLDTFTREELIILGHYLRFALRGLQGEMDRLRSDTPHLSYRQKQVKNWRRISFRQWSRLIRHHRFLDHLAQSVEAVVDGQPFVDLAPLCRGNPWFFLDFLEYELGRSRLAVHYIEAETFHPLTKRDMLRGLDIERRFFSQLINLARPLALPVGQPLVSPTFEELYRC
jgi:hypothetical protein